MAGEGGLLSELVEQGELGGWPELAATACAAAAVSRTSGACHARPGCQLCGCGSAHSSGASREGPSLWLEDGLGCQCPHRVQRCSCQWAALLRTWAAQQNSLRVRPTWHSTLVSGGGPTCIHPAGLPHCQCAGVGVESWVWYCRSGRRRHAVPAESAIRGAAVAPKAMIGLGTGDPGKDWEFGQGVKGGMRQLASLECQPQENRSPLWILDLECKWHLSPAGSFKGSQSSKELL